ncbi:hypothetical protein [Terribacillus sp. AE2B 122]|nr:hypothetical protein [Terribacillus sp. AE2B 122]
MMPGNLQAAMLGRCYFQQTKSLRDKKFHAYAAASYRKLLFFIYI